jgi:hypothetical protein
MAVDPREHVARVPDQPADLVRADPVAGLGAPQVGEAVKWVMAEQASLTAEGSWLGRERKPQSFGIGCLDLARVLGSGVRELAPGADRGDQLGDLAGIAQ